MSSPNTPTYTKTKLPFSWPSSIPNPIPHRYRRKLRSKVHSRQSPASSLTAFETSLAPSDTLRKLRKYKWSAYDAQYLLLLALAIFSLSISPVPLHIFKLAGALGLGVLLLVPMTNQFFLPFLPIGCWLIYFFSAKFIPVEFRPPIWVRVLPALENILYGANLSNILSAHQNVFFDVMAWFPYGIVHFTAPFACSAAMYIYAAPGTVAVFAKSFGYMNLLGVTIQIIFPCSPPWYENMYGLAPANYSMSGSPAGLARIDQLFGFDMYTTNFTNSPVVFGAFPSLHAGNAIIEALFMAHCFPRFRPLFIAYCMWLWWATMYLSHHYLVDLVAGSLISAIFFFIARTNFLPRRQPDKSFRWDYDYVEIGEAAGGSHDYDLAEMSGYRNRLSSDEWTVGSSSSISSRSQSPKGEDSQSMWEGETLADGQSDKNSEVSDVHIK